MKHVKNKKILIQYNLSPKIGYSDMRMHGFVMMAMIIVLVLTPLLGILAAVCVVLIFGLFFAIKIAQFQSHDVLSKLKFRLEMDRIYNGGKDVEWLTGRIELHQKRTKLVVSVPTLKKEIIKDSNKLGVKNHARLVLTSVN